MIQLEKPNPYSKADILLSIDDVCQKVISYYSSMNLELFFHSGLGGWSPAQNLSHLSDISFASLFFLKMPRIALLIFGKAETQRDFQTLMKDYMGSDKIIALGPLAPAAIPHVDGEKKKLDLLKRWETICKDVKIALADIPETEFDKYSIPHPTMGILSYREFLYLLVIHPIHHTYKVEQKISNFSKGFM